MESVFRIAMVMWIGKLLLKGTPLKTFILVFPESFKAAVFLKIAGKFF